MRLEALPKYFSPKSPHISDAPRATASDSLSITDVMASLGLAGHQAAFGIELFLAKQGISKPDNAVERLYQFALIESAKYKAADRLEEDIKPRVLQILATFAFQDYSRSAASVRKCPDCTDGFIDAEVFTMKSSTPWYAENIVRAAKGMGADVIPSQYEKRREIREVVRVQCPTCKGKGVVNNSCRCHGKGFVLDKEKTKAQGGIPAYKECSKCGGRGYSRIPGENVRKAICGVAFELPETTWRRDFKPFYEALIAQCHKEESIADITLTKITR